MTLQTVSCDRARRRAPAEGPRLRQIVVRFSAAELADVRSAAEQADAAVGAWLGDAAVTAARGAPRDMLRRLLGDVVAARALVADDDLGVRLDGLVDALTERLS